MSNSFDHKRFLQTLSQHPGVYQMLGVNEQVLYVGKAQNLKKRISSYFRSDTKNPRIASLVKQISDIKVIITASDNEALLLENNLIKKLKPHYNVLLRDDKSYAYIVLTKHKDFPRVDFYRGRKRENEYYFGPYSSVGAIRESLSLLQRLFKIRQCNDTFFKNRTRPCIQYEIKRCTAPCVNYITPEHYQQNVQLTKMFLEGKNTQLINELINKMEHAAESLAFEEAARFRDQIAALRKIQEKQYIYNDAESLDVIALASKHAVICVQILLFRTGKLIGNRAFFPKVPPDTSDDEILSNFISQYYISDIHREEIPKTILVNTELSDLHWLENGLTESAQHKVTIAKPVRGERVRWLQMAVTNADNSLAVHLASKNHFVHRLESLQQCLQLTNPPQRLECFDVSHSQGESTVASCVVFDENGPNNRAYRRYNIAGITKGDDYAAIKQVLLRRYSKMKSEEAVLPDLVIIDGGKGQLKQAHDVMENLQISGVNLLAIAKGPGRKPGLETVFIAENSSAKILTLTAEALLLLQQIRDEAHRFAITGQKRQLIKRRVTSQLEAIPGVGIQRRRQLLNYFGGLQEIKRASIEEIAKVTGVSRALAEKIYEYLHRE